MSKTKIIQEIKSLAIEKCIDEGRYYGWDSSAIYLKDLSEILKKAIPDNKQEGVEG